LVFRPGDRIALLGVNGSGKSTCIEKLMSVSQSDVGQQTSIRFNPNVQIGYFDQELLQFETRQTIFEWVQANSKTQDDTIKRSLIHWGFPYLDHSRFVNVLSGGERARLLLMTFQLNQPNLLIMDEPTNHIDLQGKEELESDLQQAGLSLLFTSHDQHFIEAVATRYWWIDQGRLQEIHDPSAYFKSFDHSPGEDSQSVTHVKKEGASVSASLSDEESILERILELEQLIEADQQRKPKFQKPKLQAQWEAELSRLNAQL
jgi:ATPase subunit of ABC transporter with duplicated ATPase domains